MTVASFASCIAHPLKLRLRCTSQPPAHSTTQDPEQKRTKAQQLFDERVPQHGSLVVRHHVQAAQHAQRAMLVLLF